MSDSNMQSCGVCGYLLHPELLGSECAECGAPLALSSCRLTATLLPEPGMPQPHDPRVILCPNAPAACGARAKRLLLISGLLVVLTVTIANSLYLVYPRANAQFTAETAGWLWNGFIVGRSNRSDSRLYILKTPPAHLGMLRASSPHWLGLLVSALAFLVPVIVLYITTLLLIRTLVLPSISHASTFSHLNVAALRISAIAGIPCTIALSGIAAFALMRIAWMTLGFDPLYRGAFYVLALAFVGAIIAQFVLLERLLHWLKIGWLRKWLALGLVTLVAIAVTAPTVLVLGVLSDFFPKAWITLGRMPVDAV